MAVANQTQKPSREGWLSDVSTIEKAKKAARQGTWAALVSSAVTTFAVGMSAARDEPVLGLDIWSLGDVVLMLVVGGFIYFKLSRTAAVIGCTAFLLGNIAIRLANLQLGSIVVTLILGVMWINSIRGTFAFHSLSQAQADTIDAGPIPTEKSNIGKIFASVGVIVVLAILGVGLSISALGPPSYVATWSEIRPLNRDRLLQSGLVDDPSDVVFVSSTALLDIRDDVLILTMDELLFQREDEIGALDRKTILLSDIHGLGVVYSDGLLDYTEIGVLDADDNEYWTFVPSERDRDRQLVSALESATGLDAQNIAKAM